MPECLPGGWLPQNQIEAKPAIEAEVVDSGGKPVRSANKALRAFVDRRRVSVTFNSLRPIPGIVIYVFLALILTLLIRVIAQDSGVQNPSLVARL